MTPRPATGLCACACVFIGAFGCMPPTSRVDAGATPAAKPAAPAAPASHGSDAGAPSQPRPEDEEARADAELWREVSRRVNVSVDELRGCSAASDCLTRWHFTRCCAHVSVNVKHKDALQKAQRLITKDLQTPLEAQRCAISDCSGVMPPSTCGAGRCVIDGERSTWTEVGDAIGASPDALRACTTDSECVRIPHPKHCCRAAAVAASFAEKVAGVRVMARTEAERCALKDCAIRGTPVCRDGLCRIAF